MSQPINSITIDHVRQAVSLSGFDPAAAQDNMAPSPRPILPENRDRPPREAGVLALLHPDDDGLQIVLTRRTDTLRGHSGQVSFPGGQRDPHDDSFTVTALRETCEELGICDEITILGGLSPFYIPPSHFNVYPSVGYIDCVPQFVPNPAEVAEVFTFPLYQLLDESSKDHEYRSFNGLRMKVPYYFVNNHKVWGATAAMLSEFEQRLRTVL